MPMMARQASLGELAEPSSMKESQLATGRLAKKKARSKRCRSLLMLSSPFLGSGGVKSSLLSLLQGAGSGHQEQQVSRPGKLFAEPLDKLCSAQALRQLSQELELASSFAWPQAGLPNRLEPAKRKRGASVSASSQLGAASSLRRLSDQSHQHLSVDSTFAHQDLRQDQNNNNNNNSEDDHRRQLLLLEVLPPQVRQLLEQLYLRGPQTVGIFRKSANAKHCRELRQRLESSAAKEADLDQFQVAVIASVFKEWLRSLPDCLLQARLYPQWMDAARLIEPLLDDDQQIREPQEADLAPAEPSTPPEARQRCAKDAANSAGGDKLQPVPLTDSHQLQQVQRRRQLLHAECLRVVRQLLDNLNQSNLVLLRAFVCVLWHIARHSDHNKMSAANLGVCVGQSLLNDGRMLPAAAGLDAPPLSSLASDSHPALPAALTATAGHHGSLSATKRHRRARSQCLLASSLSSLSQPPSGAQETAKYVPLLVAFIIDNAPALFGQDVTETFAGLGELAKQAAVDEPDHAPASAATPPPPQDQHRKQEKERLLLASADSGIDNVHCSPDSSYLDEEGDSRRRRPSSGCSPPSLALYLGSPRPDGATKLAIEATAPPSEQNKTTKPPVAAARHILQVESLASHHQGSATRCQSQRSHLAPEVGTNTCNSNLNGTSVLIVSSSSSAAAAAAINRRPQQQQQQQARPAPQPRPLSATESTSSSSGSSSGLGHSESPAFSSELTMSDTPSSSYRGGRRRQAGPSSPSASSSSAGVSSPPSSSSPAVDDETEVGGKAAAAGKEAGEIASAAAAELPASPTGGKENLQPPTSRGQRQQLLLGTRLGHALLCRVPKIPVQFATSSYGGQAVIYNPRRRPEAAGSAPHHLASLAAATSYPNNSLPNTNDQPVISAAALAKQPPPPPAAYYVLADDNQQELREQRLKQFLAHQSQRYLAHLSPPPLPHQAGYQQRVTQHLPLAAAAAATTGRPFVVAAAHQRHSAAGFPHTSMPYQQPHQQQPHPHLAAPPPPHHYLAPHQHPHPHQAQHQLQQQAVFYPAPSLHQLQDRYLLYHRASLAPQRSHVMSLRDYYLSLQQQSQQQQSHHLSTAAAHRRLHHTSSAPAPGAATITDV